MIQDVPACHAWAREAREKGNVAKSQEVNSWFMLTAATLVLLIFANGMAQQLSDAGDGGLSRDHGLR